MRTEIFKIIHLDDHTMITDYIGKLLVKISPACEYISFSNTDAALDYFENAFLKGESPDLLITDFVHPGLNGYDFANAVRQRETKIGRKPVQILLLTMLSRRLLIVRKGLKEKIFNHYLPLTISEEKLFDFLGTVIYQLRIGRTGFKSIKT